MAASPEVAYLTRSRWPSDEHATNTATGTTCAAGPRGHRIFGGTSPGGHLLAIRCAEAFRACPQPRSRMGGGGRELELADLGRRGLTGSDASPPGAGPGA